MQDAMTNDRRWYGSKKLKLLDKVTEWLMMRPRFPFIKKGMQIIPVSYTYQ